MYGSECHDGNRHAEDISSFLECVATDDEVVAKLDKSEVSYKMDEDTDEEVVVIKLPMKWDICGCCNGNGTHALHGMVIDPSEWDDDEMADYMSGRYDTQCGHCGGTGKLRVVEWDMVSDALKQEWDEWETAKAEMYHEMAMERMMGA